MAKTRTVTEYRLLVQRVGNGVKDWRARSLKAVEQRIGLLTSPEPWRFYSDRYARQKGPDDYFCCAGTRYDECCCGGTTMREEAEAKRRDLPAIESIRLQKRQITTTAWESCESPVPMAMIPCDYCAGEHLTPKCPLESAEEVDAVDPHVGVSNA